MLEQEADRFIVVGEAERSGIGPRACDIQQLLAGGSLNPFLVLGDAIESGREPPRFLGVLYSGQAIMFTRISARRVLAVCAEPAWFDEARQALNRALPTLMEEAGPLSKPVAKTISAAEATEIARNYVSAVAKTPEVSIDEVTLQQHNRRWEIQGTYRPIPFARSRRFQLQLGSGDGEIVDFASLQRTSLAPLVTGIVVILGTLLFLVWVLFLII